MLTTSDNTASLWLQSLAGTGTRINTILDSLGFKDTRVNSRTPGRENNRTQYGWGQTTPREMGSIFEKIYRFEVFSHSASERMLRLLGRNFWDENEGISVIPPTIEVFSKNGCVNASRSEAMIVNVPKTPLCSAFSRKTIKTSGGPTRMRPGQWREKWRDIYITISATDRPANSAGKPARSCIPVVLPAISSCGSPVSPRRVCSYIASQKHRRSVMKVRWPV